MAVLALLFQLTSVGLRATMRDGNIDPSNLGKGDWVYILANAQNGLGNTVSAVTNLSSLMEYEKNMGCRYIIIKSSDGASKYPSDSSPQFTSTVVAEGHKAGLYVFAYDYVYGSDINGESNMVSYAFNQGADGVVFDAEGEIQALPNPGAAATSLCSGVRAKWPNKFLAYSTFVIISQHSPFPYKEFGYYCDVAMPQAYWNDGGVGAWANYSPTTMEQKMTTEWRNWQNGLSGIWLNSVKPIVATAQGWNVTGYPVTAAQITAFANALKNEPNPAGAGGYQGVNYWRAELHPLDVFDGIRTNSIGNFPENQPPVVTNVTTAVVGATNATITWTTDQSSDSVVECGLTTSYGESFTNSPKVWYHVVTVTNRSPNTTYQYRVKSRNLGDWVGISANYAFTTIPQPVPDNLVDDGAVVYSGSWTVGTYSSGESGTEYRYASTAAGGTATATFRPNITAAGNYDVYVWYTSGGNRANNAPYTVYYNGGSLTASVNQTINGSTWVKIASGKNFAAGTGGYVQLSNNTGASGSVVIADAVKFVYLPPPPTAPAIATQPQNQNVTPGSTASFNVVASGTAPLSYQWRFNGTSITGATDSAFFTNNVQITDAGTYSVVVTNIAGTNYSAGAVLTVLVPPSIVSEPLDTAVGVGLNTSFSVTATGTPPLSYQWQFNGTNVAWGTASRLTITNAQASDAGPYTVAVSNTNGVANSAIAFLTVLDPYITNQPQDQNVGAGATANFSVVAGGTAPLSYQWFKDGVALADGSYPDGAHSATLAVQNAQAGDMANYAVLVSNPNGSVLSSSAALIGPFAPHIWPQPASLRVLAGSTASLTVSALGPGLMYQWRKEGTNLVNGGKFGNVTTANLFVTNVAAGEAGNYTVVVTNSYGQTTSAVAIVAEWPLAAWGRDDYWQTDIPGGLSNVVGIASGNYHGLAVNKDGTVSAWGAGTNYTGVLPYYAQAVVPGDLVNAVAVAGGGYHSLALKDDGTVEAWGAGTNYTGVSPRYGQAAVPTGLGNVVAIAGGLFHSLALRADGTVVGWGAGTNNSGSPHYGQVAIPANLTNVVAIASGSYHSLALKANGTVVAWGAGTINTGVSPQYGQSIVPGDLSNVVAIACGAYHSLAVKADGTVVAWGANSANQTNIPADLHNAVAVAAGSLYSVALRADGTVVGWGSSSFGQTNIPPGMTNTIAIGGGAFFGMALQNDGRPCILLQPAGLGAAAGQTISMRITAVGSSPMRYQWQHEGTNIVGATSATLILTNVQSADAGNFAAVVSNAVGVASSGSAALSVQTPARIAVQPISQTVALGAPVTFSVGAEGDGPLSYQWRLNSQGISGATDSAYTLAGAQLTDAGTYSVVVTNAYGMAASSNAMLTVLVGPGIVTQPTNQTANAGAWASFRVEAGGSEPLSYQWFFNQTNLQGGATGPTLDLANVQPADGGAYSVVIMNGAGSITSVLAILTVNVPPSITVQPQSRTNNAGTVATFQVTASGTTPLAYQWRFQGGDIGGGTASTYSRSNVQASDAGAYSVVIANVAGSITSVAATLTVNEPPAITSQPQSVNTNSGSNVTFSVTATGTSPLNYQWRFNSADITGAQGSDYTRNNAQSSDAGSYAVVVSNMAGAVTSAEAVLTISLPCPHIDSITLVPDKGFQLQIRGGPGSFGIESAPDLLGWTQMTTLTATGAVFQVTDPETNQPSRFYRVRVLE